MAAIATQSTRFVSIGVAGRVVEAVTLCGVLAYATLMRVWSLDAYTGSFDEGIRSQQLLLMAAGYRPFKDIFSSQGPLLLDLLYPFFTAFGQTLAAVRSGVVVFSLIGIVAGWWVGRLLAGPAAGLAVAVLLTLSPTYLEGSRLALAEVPTIAPALLALGAVVQYRDDGARRWLVVSAALCALALLIKPMVAHIGVPIVAIMLARRPTYRRRQTTYSFAHSPFAGFGLGYIAAELILYGAIVVGLSSLIVLLLGPTQVWGNLGAYRSAAGHQLGSDWLVNARLAANVVARERLGFFALAAVGLALGLWRRPRAAVPIAAWALAVLALFLAYGDLADKHIVYAIPPLALLGGIGIGLALEALGLLTRRDTRGAADEPRRHTVLSEAVHLSGPNVRFFAPPTFGQRLPDDPPRGAVRIALLVALGLATLAVLAYVVDVPRLHRAGRYLAVDAPKIAAERRDLAAELEIVEVMRTRATARDWVLSDNPGAAFRAGRLVIPSLADTSGTRVDAGSLTDAVAIDAVRAYQPAVVVTWARRLGRLDTFTRWLPENGYQLERTFDNGWKLYVRSRP